MTLHSPRLFLSMMALVALAALAGCSDPEVPSTGRVGEACQSSQDCEGAICVLDVCRACADDQACASEYGVGATCGGDGLCVTCEGQDGCACAEGDACDGDLSCVGGVCTACELGAEGCECFGNNSCLEGLRCADEVCEPCPAGDEGCACAEGDTCNDASLSCQGAVCAPRVCDGGEEACPCRGEDGDDNRCDDGLVCTEGGMCAACTPEFEGCPCDEEGACQNDLVCDDEDTEDEEPGTCRPARACADLGCVENQLCEEGDTGIDARCLEECAEGFTFNAETGACEVLVVANCQPDAPGSILAQCTAENRGCIEGESEATCVGCLPGFLEEGGACRAVVTCEALGCAALNRDCTPQTDATDAACAGCAMGFEEVEGACQRLPQANCQPGAELSILAECLGQNRLCVEDEQGATCGGCVDTFGLDPNTQQCVRRLCADLDCEAQGRACGGEPLAACGACNEGLTPIDPNNIEAGCREPLTCEDITCDAELFCVEGDNSDAQCQAWPCLNNNNEPDFRKVFNRQTNTCVECPRNFNCGDTGETGRFWPFFAAVEGRCICETETGFYYELGAQKAAPCDADNDGWVRNAAAISITSPDPELRTNARCDLRTIDRFVLENEYRQSLEVLLCADGPQPAIACDNDADCEFGRFCNDGACDCLEPVLLKLYESVRNDDQDELDEANDFDAPAYVAQPGGGRRLRASELNPLTRACISASADYNDNGVTDLTEWQGLEPQNIDPENPTDVTAFLRFGYYMELHEGRYERTLGQEFGRYHIREKSRCEDTFPLTYDADQDGDFWRSCTRRRDADYDRLTDHQLIGHEFGEFSCPAGAEECPLPPPLTDLTPDGEVPPHGLCDEGITLPPIDGLWRGMNHASQFKCVQIVNELPEDRDGQAPHQRLLTEMTNINGEGDYQFNACRVACPVGDTSCAADCADGQCQTSSIDNEANADLPVLACRVTARQALEPGMVGFASVRYIDSPNQYVRGCIDEFNPDLSQAASDPWKNLCPGYAFNPLAVAGQGNPGNFGQVICGCGFNYRGANCDVGCAGDSLHYGGTNAGNTCDNGYCPVAADDDGGGRRGYWMCSDTSTTEYLNNDGLPRISSPDGWTLSGEVDAQGIERTPMCEDGDDCNTGWSLRP